jgi:DNA-binding NarL/FixJ family response regulator
MEEKRVKVLVVDDEAEFVTQTTRALEASGYSVLHASSLTEAQDLVRYHRPDLVIIGTIEPRGAAFQLHRWLKNSPSFNDIPQLVVDAPPEQRLTRGWRWEEGMQLDAEDYFQKPAAVEMMMVTVKKVLDRVTRRIRVLIVDDHVVVREGIRILLGLQPDIQVVGEAIDGSEAVRKARELMPDIILMDIAMPGVDGLQATRELTEEGIPTRVLMLTQYADEANVRASERAGAFGFIPKKSASSMLLAAIRAADRGERIPVQL